MLKKKPFFNHEIFAIKAEISEINKNCKTQCSSFFLQDLQPGMGVLLNFFFCFFRSLFVFFSFKSMLTPTQIWVGLDGHTGNQFDKMADF